MKSIITILVFSFSCHDSLSQTISKFGVSISSKCQLNLYTTTNTQQEEKLSIYQCSVTSGSSMTIYRLNANTPVVF